MPTKDELEAQNEELRARVAELEAGRPATVPPVPVRPDFGLSAGEASDLAVHGVTVSPFTGETLTASTEGVETLSPTAERRDREETAKLRLAEHPDEHVTTDATPVTE